MLPHVGGMLTLARPDVFVASFTISSCLEGPTAAWERPVHSAPMTDLVDQPPRGHARVVYLGPVSPHWEIFGDWGERVMLDEFRARALARLVLLPRDDPQFRRNRERINRDAERELISLEWELGLPDGEG